MRQLIAGNWKMNGLRATAESIVTPLRAAGDLPCDLLVCPPATLLDAVSAMLAGTAIAVGAQDCHPKGAGAHTGDISAPMLRDAGAAWVLAGHSERRGDHTESDALIRAKTHAAIAAGLTPIVCVGETAEERGAGRHESVVASQLIGSLPEGFAGVVAYEPVWAIGTGHTATPQDILAMHAHIRDQLQRLLGAPGDTMRILYGGSVKPDNAASILGLANVGGALVGGASLDPHSFLAIAKAAAGG